MLDVSSRHGGAERMAMPEKPRSGNNRPTGRMTTGFQTILSVVIFAVPGYAMYGSIAESGLARYIMQLELAMIGSGAPHSSAGGT
jgi:hypothetical protein